MKGQPIFDKCPTWIKTARQPRHLPMVTFRYDVFLAFFATHSRSSLAFSFACFRYVEFHFTDEVGQELWKVWEVTRKFGTKTGVFLLDLVFAPKRRQSYKVVGWLLGWCHGLQVLDLAANKGPCWLIMHCFLSRPLEDRKRFVDERAKFHALALRWKADLWSWSCLKILDPL